MMVATFIGLNQIQPQFGAPSQVALTDTVNILRTTVNELVTNYVASSTIPSASNVVNSLTGTTYLGVSSATGTVTLTNLGVHTLTAGSNITVTSATGTPTLAVTSTPTFTVITSGTSTLNKVVFPDATTQTSAFKELGFNVSNATTSASATTTIQKQFLKAVTITQIDCSTNGANATIGADERASSTPDTLGTDVFNGGTLVCDSNGNSTSTFANATIAAGAVLNFDLDALANSTTSIRVYIQVKEQ